MASMYREDSMLDYDMEVEDDRSRDDLTPLSGSSVDGDLGHDLAVDTREDNEMPAGTHAAGGHVGDDRSLAVDNGGPSGNPGQVSEAARGDPMQLALAQLLSQGDLAKAITSAVEEQAARIFRGVEEKLRHAGVSPKTGGASGANFKTPKGRPRTHHGGCCGGECASSASASGQPHPPISRGREPERVPGEGRKRARVDSRQQAHGAVKRRVRRGKIVDAIQLQIDAIVVTSGLSDVDLLLGQPALQEPSVLTSELDVEAMVNGSDRYQGMPNVVIPSHGEQQVEVNRVLADNQRGVEMDFSKIDIGDINEDLNAVTLVLCSQIKEPFGQEGEIH
ncbi:hypothetical protein L9F63_012775, partial [Diploptera punctata]